MAYDPYLDGPAIDFQTLTREERQAIDRQILEIRCRASVSYIRTARRTIANRLVVREPDWNWEQTKR